MIKNKIKLKKEVDFKELINYGFKYIKEEDTYRRENQWLSKHVGFALIVDCKTREVGYHVFTSLNENEELDDELNVKIIPETLFKMLDLLEAVGEGL